MANTPLLENETEGIDFAEFEEVVELNRDYSLASAADTNNCNC
ncbi:MULTISPECIES: hypothetical protein [Halobacillus]|nr:MULTISPECIES: hypothetical protein [Halobacillus]